LCPLSVWLERTAAREPCLQKLLVNGSNVYLTNG
jgi:hypothetical protein